MGAQGKLTPHRNPGGAVAFGAPSPGLCWQGQGAMEGCRGVGPPQKAAGGGQPSGILPHPALTQNIQLQG